MPPGTCSMKPTATSSAINSRTKGRLSSALFPEDVHSISGDSSDRVDCDRGQAGDGVKGSLTPSGTPTANRSKKSTSGWQKQWEAECSGKEKGGKADVVCHECRNYGHFARECWGSSVRQVQNEGSNNVQPSQQTSVAAGSPSSSTLQQTLKCLLFPSKDVSLEVSVCRGSWLRCFKT